MPVRNDKNCAQERKELVDDIKMMLDNIMKVFMPAVKKRPVLLVPCPKCPKLHITLDEVCCGNTIFCSATGVTEQFSGHYCDVLLPVELNDGFGASKIMHLLFDNVIV